jgi:hypothetical protein
LDKLIIKNPNQKIMASKMDPALAKSLIQEFRDQNKAAGEHAWLTHDGQHLNGFFLDREKLENILKDEKIAGIHVYFAKHPDFAGKPDKVHTLMLSGSVPNTQPGALTPYLQSGDTVDNVPPCPPMCS